MVVEADVEGRDALIGGGEAVFFWIAPIVREHHDHENQRHERASDDSRSTQTGSTQDMWAGTAQFCNITETLMGSEGLRVLR